MKSKSAAVISVDAGERPADLTVALEDNLVASQVFGQHDRNLAYIERRLNVQLNANGNRVVIKGPQGQSDHARRVLETLAARIRSGQTLTMGDIDGAIQESVLQGHLFPQDKQGGKAFEQFTTRKRGPVRARNLAQDVYLRTLRTHEMVIADGPAGTGKTWLAVGYAVHLLEQGHVERLILSRPAVEAGERLGFLPGDMREKVDPYLRPIYDALNDFADPRMVQRGLETGQIEVAPLAFMRGRTLTNACIILDEAQNCTAMQMKMFLTRLGEGSRMIVNGDPSQIDLPRGQDSGLVEAMAVLANVEGIGRSSFTEADVVRHELVGRIVDAYGKAARALLRR